MILTIVNNDTKRKLGGFTIVELLIVVVVIAILAAITIVAYNGIQNQAKVASFAATINGATKQLEMARINSGTDTYPNPGSYTIPSSGATTFSYLLADNNTYCVTATASGVSYALAKGAKSAAQGNCVVNIVKNPKGVGTPAAYASSGWFYPLGTTTDQAGVSWGGRSDWHRFVWTGVGNGIIRLLVDLSQLQDGQTYTASVLVANPSASAASLSMDMSDTNQTVHTFAAGESRRVSVTVTRSTYTSVYRFMDIETGPANETGLLFTDAMLTNTGAVTGYGDGSSEGWSWTGTPSASISTGPAI